MSKKRFTEEETAAFRANPAVAWVSPLSIRFTEAFRQEAYTAFREGKSVIDIFEDAGLDIRVLGLPRVAAFRRKLQERAEQEAPASGEEPVRKPAKTDSEKVELRVRQLEVDLARTRQEMEFLKKLQTVNMEAMKQWESRRRRK